MLGDKFIKVKVDFCSASSWIHL